MTWEVVGWLEPTSSNNSFSMYGFLYGTIPTAPSVFLYASEYGIAQDVVGFLILKHDVASAKSITPIIMETTFLLSNI